MVNMGITNVGISYFNTKDGPYTWMTHEKPMYVTNDWWLLFLELKQLGGWGCGAKNLIVGEERCLTLSLSTASLPQVEVMANGY